MNQDHVRNARARSRRRFRRPGLRRKVEGDAGRQVRSARDHQQRYRNRRLDYDAASKKLSWKVTYSGLSGPATAAHFHGPAEAGKNAGVAVAIPNATTSPVEGSATLTDAQAADLLAGKLYVNIHTAANPGGEIRGQVTK